MNTKFQNPNFKFQNPKKIQELNNAPMRQFDNVTMKDKMQNTKPKIPNNTKCKSESEY